MNAETSARRRFTALIVGFFAAQAVLWIYAITLVSLDASHAVVADYDAKALDWDAQRARQASSDALGWSAAVELDPATGVHLTLRDADGQPLDGASVRITLFHHARASQRTSLALSAVGTGRYAAPADVARKGTWTVVVDAQRDRSVFNASLTSKL